MFNNTLKAKILVLRGLESELPTLAVGQLGYCTDTNRLFIGDAEDGNICINEVDANAVAGAIQNLENSMVELDNTVETLNNQIPGILNDLQRVFAVVNNVNNTMISEATMNAAIANAINAARPDLSIYVTNETFTREMGYKVSLDEFSRSLDTKQSKEPGKGLSTNDLTDDLVAKINKIDETETYVTETELTSTLSNKVDVVSGKGLSTNDLTNELKTKIEGSAQISSEVSLPAATAADKGKIVIVTDSSTNTDKVYICVLNNGTYVYKEMTLV